MGHARLAVTTKLCDTTARATRALRLYHPYEPYAHTLNPLVPSHRHRVRSGRTPAPAAAAAAPRRTGSSSGRAVAGRPRSMVLGHTPSVGHVAGMRHLGLALGRRCLDGLAGVVIRREPTLLACCSQACRRRGCVRPVTHIEAASSKQATHVRVRATPRRWRARACGNRGRRKTGGSCEDGRHTAHPRRDTGQRAAPTGRVVRARARRRGRQCVVIRVVDHRPALRGVGLVRRVDDGR